MRCSKSFFPMRQRIPTVSHRYAVISKGLRTVQAHFGHGGKDAERKGVRPSAEETPSFCLLRTRMLYHFGGFAEPVCFYLAGAHLPFLSGDGANALNCFTRDCETRETGLEGALRCSRLPRNQRERGWVLYGSWTRGCTRPKKCASVLFFSPLSHFQSLSLAVKYF